MTEEDRVALSRLWSVVSRSDGTEQGWSIGMERAGEALRLLRGTVACTSRARPKRGSNTFTPVRIDGESDAEFTRRWKAERVLD